MKKKTASAPAARNQNLVTAQPVRSWTTNEAYKTLLLEAAGLHGAPDNIIYAMFNWLAPGAKFKEGWRMRATSNGSFYLVPGIAPKTIEMHCPSNHHTAIVTAKAAGITATLFALSHMA